MTKCKSVHLNFFRCLTLNMVSFFKYMDKNYYAYDHNQHHRSGAKRKHVIYRKTLIDYVL